MKMLKPIKLALLGSISLLLVTFSLRVAAQPGSMVSFQLFYDQLSPYGEWVNDPDYGYIWLPDAGPNFMPYATNGHWVMTKYGNTWVSNYEWGWAPFHYGRWVHTEWYGWAWIPDYEWGPAWVSWRSGGGYYGWAPLGPRMHIAVNIRIPASHWIYVPNRYIMSPRIHRYYVPRRNHVTIYNRTTIINNTYIYNNRTYVSGPSHRDIERATRSRVSVREITNSSQPRVSRVDSRSVSLYRPSIDQNTRTQARPTRVTDAEKARTNAVSRNTATRGTATRATTPAPSTRTGNREATTRPTTTAPSTRAGNRETTTRPTTTQSTRATTTNRANREVRPAQQRRNTTVERSERSTQQSRQTERNSRTRTRDNN